MVFVNAVVIFVVVAVFAIVFAVVVVIVVVKNCRPYGCCSRCCCHFNPSRWLHSFTYVLFKKQFSATVSKLLSKQGRHTTNSCELSESVLRGCGCV